MGDSHAVDIPSLAQQLREELAAADAPPPRLPGGCPIVIAVVGELTRNVDPAEYVPHHVCIGPNHRSRSPPLARDDEKLRNLRDVMSVASAGVTLEDYLGEVARIEWQARSCYDRTFEQMSSADFVRMLLLDACYLLVRFGHIAGRRGNGGGAAGAAPSVGGGDMMEAVAVVRDALYLAENQIPFFVVDKVHRLTVPDAGVPATDAIAGYVRELLRGQQYSVATPVVAAPPGPGNLLHLLHMHLTPTALSPHTTGSRATGGKRQFGRWRTAAEYHCAGVGFRARPLGGIGGARSILDVKLNRRGSTLEIPRLNVDAETWRLLRNLMALEQSNPAAAGSHVTAYCVFVSQLACTPRDVELLSRRGVISHGLGGHDEVAGLLAGLCKGVAFRPDDPVGNYLHATWQAMEGRFRSRPRRWAAWLMLKYFTNPWLAVGLAAAAVGLLCTVVQAVYAVLSYTPAT
ncbi:hypothetical protein SETIT_6G129700v2 [Setaria italica]|uniref:Uncharacterized protein n=1 Tax=Setaria italica TaxID=4555 RepID=K3YHI9_SETIT|nr:uncharacterized protein LOC101756275 [Setaria italica]RCV30860.1 hypothetical protein SETIT_6G129700v2 [Setaria italica]